MYTKREWQTGKGFDENMRFWPLSCYHATISDLHRMETFSTFSGPLCREFTRHYWIPLKKGQWRGALMFSFISAGKKRSSNQSRRPWFESPSHPLWRHCNEEYWCELFAMEIPCTGFSFDRGYFAGVLQALPLVVLSLFRCLLTCSNQTSPCISVHFWQIYSNKLVCAFEIVKNSCFLIMNAYKHAKYWYIYTYIYILPSETSKIDHQFCLT